MVVASTASAISARPIAVFWAMRPPRRCDATLPPKSTPSMPSLAPVRFSTSMSRETTSAAAASSRVAAMRAGGAPRASASAITARAVRGFVAPAPPVQA